MSNIIGHSIATRTFRSTLGTSLGHQWHLSTSAVNSHSDRSRRFDRRKDVGVITLIGDNDHLPQDREEKDLSRTSPESETGPDMHTRHHSTRLRPQRVIDISGISRAYQESATVRHRRQLQRDQQMSQSRESGSVVVSTSAAAQHRWKSSDRVSDEGRKTMKTNPSSLKIPTSKVDEPKMLMNQPGSKNLSTEKEELAEKEKLQSWGPTLIVGGLFVGSAFLLLTSGTFA